MTDPSTLAANTAVDEHVASTTASLLSELAVPFAVGTLDLNPIRKPLETTLKPLSNLDTLLARAEAFTVATEENTGLGEAQKRQLHAQLQAELNDEIERTWAVTERFVEALPSLAEPLAFPHPDRRSTATADAKGEARLALEGVEDAQVDGEVRRLIGDALSRGDDVLATVLLSDWGRSLLRARLGGSVADPLHASLRATALPALAASGGERGMAARLLHRLNGQGSVRSSSMP